VVVACRPGAVAVTELQLEGKKRLRASEFIAGRKLADGARFVRVQEEGA
jgi:methionyl-tRNA formyltransferase